MNLLDKQIVLKLNKNWAAFEQLTVRKAITMLCGDTNGEVPGFAMDFVTAKDENGDTVLVYANPVTWDDWVKLPVREQDLSIETSRGPIRVPLIVICAHYDKIPTRKPRFHKGAIAERDGYVCQYTGEKLSKSGGNIDHVIPRDRGGKDTWENTVYCKKELNFKKGNSLNHEIGYKLIRQPKAPSASVKIITEKHLHEETREQQKFFLFK